MNTPRWIEYDGSDNQIKEIKTASNGVMFEYVGGIGTDPSIFKYENDQYHIDNIIECKAIDKYLICHPHPYADLIDIWRVSGCPVWIKFSEKYDDIDFINCTVEAYLKSGTVFKTTFPNWNIPGAEYRLTPFED